MDSIDERLVGGKSGVGVLDKAVAILSFVAAEGPIGLGGVVGGTGLPRPTAHRLLSALEAHHLLVRGEGGYSLGSRLLGWGNRAAGTSLVEAARPVLAALRDATGESVQLYVREGDLRVCVASFERAGGGLRDSVPVGAVLPLGLGSGGKVLLAWAEDAGRPAGVEAAELEGIRRRGWAESVAEREAGAASVSAPVFGSDGKTSAAVCASGPTSRLGERPGERLAEKVAAAAGDISYQLSAVSFQQGNGGDTASP